MEYFKPAFVYGGTLKNTTRHINETKFGAKMAFISRLYSKIVTLDTPGICSYIRKYTNPEKLEVVEAGRRYREALHRSCFKGFDDVLYRPIDNVVIFYNPSSETCKGLLFTCLKYVSNIDILKVPYISNCDNLWCRNI